MEFADLCADSVFGERVFNLTGDVSIDIAEPITQQRNQDERDCADRYQDADNDCVPASNDAASASWGRRASFLCGRLWFVHRHRPMAAMAAKTSRNFPRRAEKTEVRGQKSEISISDNSLWLISDV